MGDEFATRLKTAQDATEAVLEKLLSDEALSGEIARPPRLLAAMRHAALGGGKRLRPFILIESARLFGRATNDALGAAAALECVHCYSLVHDDLPAMDDDDLRRGRPTVHKAFDEATAILAGDALLTLAFAVLADPATDPDPAVRAELVAGLAAAAGLGGMAGGQMLDLAGGGPARGEADIRLMQAMKTGALFRFAAEAGAILARATANERQGLARFGAALGLAFQLADDLIDATASSASAGKATAKDAGRGKATLVAVHGVDGAMKLLDAAVNEALTILRPFGSRADMLREAARFVAAREG
jgi:farnesyl diphosphate synthase